MSTMLLVKVGPGSIDIKQKNGVELKIVVSCDVSKYNFDLCYNTY